MARKSNKIALTPRKVKFNVKATPVVRKARNDLLNAVVACKGREADLDGLQDTLEVVAKFLAVRGERDMKNRASNAKSAAACAAANQKALDEGNLVTAALNVKYAETAAAKAYAAHEVVAARHAGLTVEEYRADMEASDAMEALMDAAEAMNV